PSNVLLDADEHVYLADFGLSRRLSDQGVPVPQGLSLGTPAYAAPEQIRGERVDGRADLYSLACLLYECFAGEPPFPSASELATLWAHLQEEPVAPAAYPALAPVFHRAMAKDPSERQPTCGRLVEEGRGALGIAEPLRPRWLRAPVLASLVGLLLIAASLAAYFAFSGGGGAHARRDTLVRIDPATNQVVDSMPIGA